MIYIYIVKSSALIDAEIDIRTDGQTDERTGLNRLDLS